MTKHEDTAMLSGVGSSDVLERAASHLRAMPPHVRTRLTAKLLDEACKDLKWERGRWPGKITMHWLKAAFDRVAAGEPENEVMADYGYAHAAHEPPATKTNER